MRTGIIRRISSVLLAVLLVSIQQFGFAHALTHLKAPASSTAPKSDVPHPAEKVCIECVAFAQLGAALSGAAAPAHVIPAAIERLAVPLISHAAVFAPHFRSRAPPRAA